MITTVIATAALALSTLTGGFAATVQEDSPEWDCRTMGNQVCGPSNDQGMTAGQYANGALVPWSASEVPAWCNDICLGA